MFPYLILFILDVVTCSSLTSALTFVTEAKIFTDSDGRVNTFDISGTNLTITNETNGNKDTYIKASDASISHASEACKTIFAQDK